MLDYYEGVVVSYLRADRALFLNTECCIQLNEEKNPDHSGPHWYCDAVAIDLRNERVYLCEISYSLHLSALLKRVSAWHAEWDGVHNGLIRDSHIPPSWPLSLWLFVPLKCTKELDKKLALMNRENRKFEFRVTALEDVQPWNYSSWDRIANPGTLSPNADEESATSAEHSTQSGA